MKSRKTKSKPALPAQQKQRNKPKPETSGGRERFDQLLDDAIFGVKPKAPRG